MDKIEFDTSELAWITYKVFYGCNFKIKEKDRKYSELQIENNNIQISGDTDFNFGPGWSNSIANKYEGYLGEIPQEHKKVYQHQLSICKELFYSIVNVSLMPRTGNLQNTKKGLGNDRLDTFIWALSSYYDGETSLLFNNATFQNTTHLKEYFKLFINGKSDPIYNYCSYIYGISDGLVDDFIKSGKLAIDSPERVIGYMRLAYRFWNHKLMRINEKMNNSMGLLSDAEQMKMSNEIERVTKALSSWFDETE